MITTTLTTTKPSGCGHKKRLIMRSKTWLRGQDLNLRPSGYEPERLKEMFSSIWPDASIAAVELDKKSTFFRIKTNKPTTTMRAKL